MDFWNAYFLAFLICLGIGIVYFGFRAQRSK